MNSAALEKWEFPAQITVRPGQIGEPEPARTVNVPIWAFFADGERVICDRPVEVTLSGENEGFFAQCERLHVFASAESPEECMQRINEQVIHFFKTYTELADNQVTGLAQELRALYVDHFRPG